MRSPRERITARGLLAGRYDQIMLDKEIDIEVSHNHPVNKFAKFICAHVWVWD